jgi:uncharacterized membrane protein
VHWGLDGRPDGYAPAWLGLFVLPAVATVVIAVLATLPRIEPRRENLERSLTAYVGVGIAVIVLLAVLQVAIALSALGSPVDMLAVALVGVGGVLIVLGNFLSKTRSNWTIGLRTPWTLSSERAWTRTHRLGSLLFIADGIVIVVTTSLVGARVAIWVALAVLAVSVVVGVVYSYLVWRSDPTRSDVKVGR